MEARRLRRWDSQVRDSGKVGRWDSGTARSGIVGKWEQWESGTARSGKVGRWDSGNNYINDYSGFYQNNIFSPRVQLITSDTLQERLLRGGGWQRHKVEFSER